MKEQAAVFCCDECHHTDSYIHVNTDSFKKFVGRKKTARRRLLWLSKNLKLFLGSLWRRSLKSLVRKNK